uniref:G-protein coupled receptors family 1 profile domain-containing protein n=1 Tax=Equus asinus TaxID=9793 RepID=A0A9L0I6W7_EQUAS
MYFFLSHLSSVTSAIPQQLGPRCWWTSLPRASQSPSLAWLCDFLSSLSFQILSVYCWQWWPLIGTRTLEAHCSTVNMSSRACSLLVAGVYLVGIADALIHTTLTFCLGFSGSNEMSHFFCHISPPLSLSYSDTQINELVICTIIGFTELSTISGVLVSYCCIILSFLKIHTAEGRLKAFSTCVSHLTAVAISQGTTLFMYFRASPSYTLDQDK